VKKIPLAEIKALPPTFFLRLIKKMKKKLKEDEVMRKIFQEYETDINELDFYPMKFGNLDVSAKTDHGIIIFNYKLLCDGDFEKDYSYAIHEVTHVLQQTTGNKPTQGADDGSYLDNPHEKEGFQNQVEYIANDLGEEAAEDYVDNLLEYHDIEDNKEFKNKKETLMSKV
jgi:hypothetical protein